MKLVRSVQLNPYLLFAIPLVEVVFLLFLFLIVSTTLLVHPGIAVNLPSSRFTLNSAKNPVVITVTAGAFPTIYFQNQKTTLTELGKTMNLDHATEKTIIIRADQATPNGTVVQVMNLCLERGYSVVLATSADRS